MRSIKVAVVGVIRVGIIIVGIKLFIIIFLHTYQYFYFTLHLLISIMMSPAINMVISWLINSLI